jgi:hypothetical protein
MGTMDSGVGARLARAGERLFELFKHDDNVTGVAVGFRRRGGKLTDEPVVTVMVRKKRRPALVSRRRMIPAAIDVDGTPCPTDVVQAQAVLMNAGGYPGERPERIRGIKWGSSTSNLADATPDAGTITAIVRDNTDGTTGILSANHVIADSNRAPRNDPIYQPGELDWTEEEEARTTTIGRLKRWVTIAGGATAVDAALAQVEAGIRINAAYRGVELEPPGTRDPNYPERYPEIRPAIGMVVAGDGFGNVWLTSMATTLRELNVSLLPTETARFEASAPALGSVIEKVGRTTAYTTGWVHRTGESVTVEVPGTGAVTYTGCIKTQWFAWSGDSGAMAIRKGGSGIAVEALMEESKARITRLISRIFRTCEVLSAIQFSFEVPITRDAALSDEVRDDFMAQSETGRFLITLTYLNTALLNRRMERRQSATLTEYANALYRIYQPTIAEVMAGSGRTLNEADREAYYRLLSMLRTGGVLLEEEYNGAVALGRAHEEAVRGMARPEVTAYMDQYSVFNSVRNTTVNEMRALVQSGPARVMGAF